MWQTTLLLSEPPKKNKKKQKTEHFRRLAATASAHPSKTQGKNHLVGSKCTKNSTFWHPPGWQQVNTFRAMLADVAPEYHKKRLLRGRGIPQIHFTIRPNFDADCPKLTKTKELEDRFYLLVAMPHSWTPYVLIFRPPRINLSGCLALQRVEILKNTPNQKND